jgi:hypothetical protein
MQEYNHESPIKAIKERLHAHIDLIGEYECQLERLARLTASIQAPKAQTYDGMHGGGSSDGDHIAIQVTRKMELEQDIENMKKDIRYDEAKIDAIIRQLDSAEERGILRLRYIDAEDWEEVARIQYHKKADYQRDPDIYLRRAYRKHGEALAKLAKIMPLRDSADPE